VGSMIALGRLHHLFGIPRGEATWFPLEVADKFSRIGDANPHALAIGLITLLVVFGLNRHAKKYPVALLAIALGMLYADFFPGATVMRVGDIQAVPSGLPAFVSPFFPGWPSVLRELFAPAMAVAVVGLIEAVSIGQTLAVKHRLHLNFNQEFFGQGLGVAVSAFFQGMPGSGSFSRSALIEQCGGKTRFANVWFGLVTAMVLLFLPGLLERIPTASLAALLLYIGVRLIDPVRVKRLFRTSRMDVLVMVSTLLITVLVRIEYGIFTGMILGALLILHRMRELHIHEVLPCPDGSFEEVPYTPGSRHEPSAIVGLSVHGNLFYSVAHELLEQLNEIATHQDPLIVVLRTRRAFSIDFSCWNAIFDFAAGLQKRGGKLYLAGIDIHTKKTIHDARAHKWLSDEQLFTGTDTLMESFSNAMRAAAERIPDPKSISGAWRDWLENPVVVTEEQVREIQRFLRGEA
jgi:sulfate permease, SulP family